MQTVIEQPAVAPRFKSTSCSQCGGTFGPGEHGFSSCTSHRSVSYTAPAAAHSHVVFNWNAGLAEPVVCHLAHEPAERGLREDGVQMAPDFPASMILAYAYLRGLNIYEMLTCAQVAEIEGLALDEVLS